MGCFTWLVLLGGGVMVMVSIIRWFEQTTDAVDAGAWDRLVLLVVMPFSVWFFPSKISAGRPTAVPRHEPVRGFGSLGKKGGGVPFADKAPAGAGEVRELPPRLDEPPPGTPPEFLVKPVVPKKPVKKAAPDPEKIEKLRRKMMEQGMLPKDEGKGGDVPRGGAD